MQGGSIAGIRQSEQGLTLVEMLVVLVIIAIMAGATTLGIGVVTRGPTVETEARRLQQLLQAAADDAMIGDRLVAFTVEKHGYGFAFIGEDGQPREAQDALGFHKLPGGMVMTLSIKPPVLLGVDGSGKPLSATLTSGKQVWRVTYDGMIARAAPVQTP